MRSRIPDVVQRAPLRLNRPWVLGVNVLLGVIALVLVMLFQGAGMRSALSAQPMRIESAAQRDERATSVIPWGEANSYQTYYYDRTLDGLRYWRTVVDEAIVTTHPDAAISDPVIRGMVSELAPMRIIPGVQVNPPLVNRLDNVDGWQKVAECVRRLTGIAGCNKFVIDAELAWKQMRRGAYVPDWDRVCEGLRLLPQDVEYIWYPSIACWVDRPTRGPWCDDDLGLQTKFLLCVTETLAHVSLVTFEHRVPESATYKWEIARQEYVKKHFDVPTFPIVYFEPDHWKPEQLIAARDTCKSDVMLAYFGVANWAKCADVGPRALRVDMEKRLTCAESDLATMRGRAERAEWTVSTVRELVAE